MENFNYDCIGNEALINDCPKNNNRCPAISEYVGRTELSCKGKNQLF